MDNLPQIFLWHETALHLAWKDEDLTDEPDEDNPDGYDWDEDEQEEE